MASVGFRIRSKLNKNVSVKMYLSLGRKSLIELNSGFTINPKDWSLKTNLPIQNNVENKLLFNNLKKLEAYIHDNLNLDNGKGIIIDRLWLESKINECFSRVEKVDEGLLTNRIQFIIDNAGTRKVRGKKRLGLSLSRVKSYVTFKNLIVIYQTGIKKQIHLLDINKVFVDNLINWLINTKGYSMNYAGKQIDNLKTVCLDAEKMGVPINAHANQIESFSESDEDRYIVTLSFDELKKIEGLKIENRSLNNARNWILLGCAFGQRGNDLLHISQEKIRQEKEMLLIDIYQSKNDKWVTVPILSPHLIDIVKNNFPYTISTQKLNNYIKDVCKLAEINVLMEGKKKDKDSNRKLFGIYPKYELITSHCFRRSFATNYYKKMPTAILINITGHTRESLFLTYINKREDKDGNAAMFSTFYNNIHSNE
jgi:hypothetical protein